ncbi:hypothetical protein SAY87_003950 [Trapa incisa]|uniref:Dof zinc finger protein n=1 Tax=Trapa incisa TaxID=236973 RepID=A0AAN7PL76_9MYRT|nr:hypothetical protein SAY87_003950 [Trapa incisa]
MQDIHSIAGGRVFSGSGGSVEKRLQSTQHHQALKCPRCESLDTKFCYYNNYNLSQPRHFCKNCRRYWTEGGVLRNVPVGGGCRKVKRSKLKSPTPADSSPVAAESKSTTRTTAAAETRDRETRYSLSHSNSERSCTLTAATTSSAEASGGLSATPARRMLSSVLDINEYKPTIMRSMNSPPVTGFNQELLKQGPGCGLFSGLIGSSAEPLPFSFSGGIAQSSHWNDQRSDREQMPSSDGCAFLEQTVQVDPPALGSRPQGSEAFCASDWPPSTYEGGMLDQAYWSRECQWAEEDDPQPGPPFLH